MLGMGCCLFDSNLLLIFLMTPTSTFPPQLVHKLSTPNLQDWASENPGNWSEKFHKALSTGEEALFDAYIKDIRANASKGLAKLDNRRILEGLA